MNRLLVAVGRRVARILVLFFLMPSGVVASWAQDADFSVLLGEENIVGALRADSLSAVETLGAIRALDRSGYWIPERLPLLGRSYMRAGKFDAAAATYGKYLEKMPDLPDYMLLDAIYQLSFANLMSARYGNALDGVYDILVRPKADSLAYYDVEAYMLVASVYDKLRDNRNFAHWLNKASASFKALDTPDSDVAPNILNHIRLRLETKKANFYMSAGKHDKALPHAIGALNADVDPTTRGVLLMDLARIYEATGRDSLAEATYADFFELVSRHAGARINEPFARHNYILYLMRRGRYEESLMEARDFLFKSEMGANRHVKGSVYEIMGQTLHALGRHEEAYDALWESRGLLDSVYTSGARLEGSDAVRDFEARLVSHDLSVSRMRERRNMALIVVLLFIGALIVAALVWTGRRFAGQKRISGMLMRRQREQQALHDVEMEKSRGELSEASREMVSLSMKMAEMEAVVADIKTSLNLKGRRPENVVSEVRDRIMRVNPAQQTWDVFRLYFEKSHPKFLNHLHALHPDLTPGETKMCAFIHMGLTTKEIAALTSRSERGVDSMKYRLHKKLGLAAGQSTREYLLSLTPQY